MIGGRFTAVLDIKSLEIGDVIHDSAQHGIYQLCKESISLSILGGDCHFRLGPLGAQLPLSKPIRVLNVIA